MQKYTEIINNLFSDLSVENYQNTLSNIITYILDHLNSNDETYNHKIYNVCDDIKNKLYILSSDNFFPKIKDITNCINSHTITRNYIKNNINTTNIYDLTVKYSILNNMITDNITLSYTDKMVKYTSNYITYLNEETINFNIDQFEELYLTTCNISIFDLMTHTIFDDIDRLARLIKGYNVTCGDFIHNGYNTMIHDLIYKFLIGFERKFKTYIKK